MLPARNAEETEQDMRVLLTTDVAGGVWSYTEELAAGLVRRGHAVLLVAAGGEPAPMHRQWLAANPAVEFATLACPLEWMPEPEPDLTRSVAALRRLADAFAPDVLHLNQFFYGAADFGAPKLVVAHSDVVSWWHAVKKEAPPADPWFHRYRRWVAEGLQGADVRAAPSAWMASRVQQLYGCGPVRVVHNARCSDAYGVAARPRQPCIVTAGRLWDEGKGAQDLAAAAARLQAANEAAHVVVAGPREHPAGGPSFPADAPGMEWRGVLPPEELRALLTQAQVYAATSRYEPFGLAPLEAALAGCALVLSDIPTFRELWEGYARFYPPGDAHALAAVLQELLHHPAERGRLAHAAAARARTHFNPTRMVEEYVALYRTAAGARRPTAQPERTASIATPDPRPL